MKDALVFDIGGTNLRGAQFSFEQDRLVYVCKRATPNIWNSTFNKDAPFKSLINGMKSLSDELFPDYQPEFVTVAFPGPITPDNKILSTPTILGEKFNGITDLSHSFQYYWPGSSISIINDVTAAGYYLKETFQEDFCVITVSSGIGSKLFINGKPYTGKLGRGGEIGHWVTDLSKDALTCECGGKGHLGGISSGRGTLAFAKKYAKEQSSRFLDSFPGQKTSGNADLITNEMLVEGFIERDAWTNEVVDEPAKHLAKAMAMIHTTTGIESFIIIGGFSTALGEPYRRSLVNFANQYCWELGQDWNEMIHMGSNDIEMGLLGAGIYSKILRRKMLDISHT